MPASMWIALALLLASLTPYGAFFVLLLFGLLTVPCAYLPLWPATIVAKSIGTNPVYIWPTTVLFALGCLFLAQAVRSPEDSRNQNAAIVVFGFLLASVISINQLKGWAGV
jgi:hypothetical protein